MQVLDLDVDALQRGLAGVELGRLLAVEQLVERRVVAVQAEVDAETDVIPDVDGCPVTVGVRRSW